MFDFYKADDDSNVHLYLPEDAGLPASVSQRNWTFQFNVRNPGSFQRERIETQGYFMCRSSGETGSWIELVAYPFLV
jgi:hypothetical protein